MVAIGIFCHNSSNFDEKQYIFVETISVMSNFDGYSDFKDTKKVAKMLATFFSITIKTILMIYFFLQSSLWENSPSIVKC